MRYTFELHDGEWPISGDVWFADSERALDHAHTVVRELMFAREQQCRSWRLDVYANGTRVHEVPFASIDPTLDYLAPAQRRNVEKSNAALLRSNEAKCSTRATRREARALVARSRGKPYLATERGEPTIRTSPPNVGDQQSKRRPE